MRIKPDVPFSGNEEEKKDPVPVQNQLAQDMDSSLAQLMTELGMQQNYFIWEKETEEDSNGSFEQQMAKFDRHIRKDTFKLAHRQNLPLMSQHLASISPSRVSRFQNTGMELNLPRLSSKSTA